MKKRLLLTLSLIFSLSSLAWGAASSNMRSSGAFSGGSADNPVVEAIYQASNVFYNLINPSAITLTLSDYNGSTNNVLPVISTEQFTNLAVQQFIRNYMGIIPDDALLTDSSKGQDVNAIKKRIGARTLQSQFLFLLRGSDSVYANTKALYRNKDYGKPKKTADEMYLMSTLIDPTDYTQQQYQMAKWFVDLFSQSYISPAEGLDFTKFKEAMHNGTTAEQKEVMKTLLTDPAYQNYIRTLRSTTAMNSVIYDNLFYLISERKSPRLNEKPFPFSLITKSKIDPPKPGEAPKRTNSSPLSIAAYQAKKAERPEWINKLSAAAPGDVQKAILLELAQIHHALYQQHLDNERIIATLSSQLASTKAGMAAQMAQTAQNANQAIDNAAQIVNENDDEDNKDEDQNSSAQDEDNEKEVAKSSRHGKKKGRKSKR